ncbi:MAG: Rpn family recombination-promoting nuclease/putative transposase [Cyanobacteria bacterium P01_A01_bin.105]
MFDSVCKFLVETFPSDFASWLLGEPVELTELSPSELSGEPIRADALILLQSQETILHIEFQTRPVAEMAFRMLDYRVRVYRRFPQKTMRQVIVYLKPTQSPLVYQNCFEIPNTHHSYDVIRLWEQPVETLLNTPGLAAFATLGQTNAPVDTLRQIAARVRAIPDLRLQRNVAASAATLAGILLEEALILRIMGQDILEDSSFYQAILAKGREKGIQEGRQEGRQEGIQEGRQEGIQEGRQEGIQEGRQEGLFKQRALILRQLTKKIGSLSETDTLNVSALSFSQLQELGDALLDFCNQADLGIWLRAQTENLDTVVRRLTQTLGALPDATLNRLQMLSSTELEQLKVALPTLSELTELTGWLDNVNPA